MKFLSTFSSLYLILSRALANFFFFQVRPSRRGSLLLGAFLLSFSLFFSNLNLILVFHFSIFGINIGRRRCFDGSLFEWVARGRWVKLMLCSFLWTRNFYFTFVCIWSLSCICCLSILLLSYFQGQLLLKDADRLLEVWIWHVICLIVRWMCVFFF